MSAISTRTGRLTAASAVILGLGAQLAAGYLTSTAFRTAVRVP